MIVNVFIPTYRRLISLDAVLYSLLKNDDLSPNFILKCYVVNNFPPNKTDVDDIVERYNQSKNRWEFIAIHRKETIPPVLNWYSAIRDYTKDGEIAFLQGDDDLFLPKSISYRVTTILNENADLLLTKQVGGVLFHDNTTNISVANFKYTSKPEELTPVHWADDKWSAIFIGNNTYRMTPLLRKAFDKSMDWCDEQHWLEFDQRTLMYPLYIPIALNLLNGKVVNSNQACVIRSMNIDECRKAYWGVPGWNSGFLHWACLGVLNNSDLKPIALLDQTRRQTNDYVAHWFLTFYFDPRISFDLRKIMVALIGRPKWNNTTRISSIVFLAKGFLTKIRLYNKLVDLMKGRKANTVVSDFINDLYQ